MKKIESVCLISVDVETTGPVPWPYSLMSIGACLVERPEERQFYAELKPISRAYVQKSIEIGASHLDATEGKAGLNGIEVILALEKKGSPPENAMERFAEWIRYSSAGRRPVLVAHPSSFDGMFVSWYFSYSGIENPFGHNAFDIGSWYSGLTSSIGASLRDAEILVPREAMGRQHHALDDAIRQAYQMKGLMEIHNVRAS